MLTTLEIIYGLIYLSIEHMSSQQSLQTAQLKPSSISTVSGIAVSTGPGVNVINDKWNVNVATQKGADLHISMTDKWGFDSLYKSSMQLTISGNTSNTTYHKDGELVFVFSVDNDYFAEMVSLDKIKASYQECPASTSPLITRNISEMITSSTPDRIYRFCGNSVATPIDSAINHWNNVGNIYRQPANWPMIITIINDPINNNIAYTWADSMNGLNRVSSQYTSSFHTDKGFNIFISGESPNEHFYIFSIDVAYRIHYPPPTLYPTNNPISSPTNNPTPSPTPTNNPSVTPTNNPSRSPTYNPSMNPTISPTSNPTTIPTIMPSISPTNIPTDNPSTNPTIYPSIFPTYIPTINPTINPSINPTKIPTYTPSINPSTYPTNIPSLYPSINPSVTVHPTIFSFINPTSESPSKSPSINPTKAPSMILITDIIMNNGTNIIHVLNRTQSRNNNSLTWFHTTVIIGGVLLFFGGLIIIFRLMLSSKRQHKRTMEGMQSGDDNSERDRAPSRYNSESAMVPIPDFLNVHIPIGMYEGSSRKTTDLSKSEVTPCAPILNDYGGSIHELHLKRSETEDHDTDTTSDTDLQDNLYGHGTRPTNKGDGESFDSFDIGDCIDI